MSEDDVICTGAEECKMLKNASYTIEVGDKIITVRPENCSGRHPHRFRTEEDRGHMCSFLNKWVESKRLWMRAP